jgi:hypothetical protein
LIACVRYKDVEEILRKEGFLFVGGAEGHFLFGNRHRPGTKPQFCTLHRPNPRDTIAEISVIESFEAAEISIPKWDVVWSD